MPVLNFEMPEDLHRRAKVLAAMQGTTLKAFVIAAIEAAVEKAESVGK